MGDEDVTCVMCIKEGLRKDCMYFEDANVWAHEKCIEERVMMNDIDILLEKRTNFPNKWIVPADTQRLNKLLEEYYLKNKHLTKFDHINKRPEG